MSGVAVAIGGAALVGGTVGLIGASNSSNAIGNAAQLQANAANNATNLQAQEFQTQLANEKPWLQAGQTALPQLQSMSQNPAQFSFTPQDFAANMDPAYQFDMQQGSAAVQASAAAKGSLMSGGTLKDLTSYGQGMASNEYSNAYNRAYQNFTNNQNTQFNRLASLAGIGQTANSQIGAAGSNMANNVGNVSMSNANAQGASQIAQANLMGNTLTGITSGVGNGAMGYAQIQNTNNLINKMYPGIAPGGGASGNLMTPSQSSYWGTNPYASGGSTLSNLPTNSNSLAMSEMG